MESLAMQHATYNIKNYPPPAPCHKEFNVLLPSHSRAALTPRTVHRTFLGAAVSLLP